MASVTKREIERRSNGIRVVGERGKVWWGGTVFEYRDRKFCGRRGFVIEQKWHGGFGDDLRARSKALISRHIITWQHHLQIIVLRQHFSIIVVISIIGS